MVQLSAMILVIMVAAPSGAAHLPGYDLDAYCIRTNPPGSHASASKRLRCLDEEQVARDALQDVYSDLTAARRQHCDGIARASGRGPYVVLRGCVEDAEQTASPA